MESEKQGTAVGAAPTSVALTADQIIKAVDIKPVLIDVPEWGGSVYVRGLTGSERDSFEASVSNMDNQGKSRVNLRNFRARLVVLGLCDDRGQRLFSDEQVGVLAKKSALALERVFDQIRHLSGMTDEDLASMEGNLKGQSEGSPTA